MRGELFRVPNFAYGAKLSEARGKRGHQTVDGAFVSVSSVFVANKEHWLLRRAGGKFSFCQPLLASHTLESGDDFTGDGKSEILVGLNQPNPSALRCEFIREVHLVNGRRH